MGTELQQTISFTDFSKGEWSLYGGVKAQPGTFTAENMIVRANGMIGPRGGLKDITPTSMPTGTLLALAAGPTPGKDGFMIIGNQVYFFDLFSSTAPTTMGILGTTPTVALYPYLQTTKFYVAVPGDTTYACDPIAGTTSALAGAPGGTLAVQFGVRLLVAESTSSNRFFVSDPSNFASWPPSNFIDVGDNWQITAMIVQRNQLAIMKVRGIYVLSGTPTVSEVIRLSNTVDGPISPFHAACDSDDIIYFVGFDRDNPATFDGANTQQQAFLQELVGPRDGTTPTPPLNRGVITMQGGITTSTAVIAQKDVGGVDRFVAKHNGVWTRHPVEVDISGLMTEANGQVVFTDGGGASSAAHIYTTRLDLERPAFTSDGLVGVGDGSNTPFHAELTLPEWFSPDGSEVSVRAVTVDFVKWNTGASATNHFEVYSRSLGGFNRAGNTTTGVQQFDEAGSAATTSGVSDRRTFNVERQRGGGFQVFVDNIRGVDIRSIDVAIQMFPNNPRN